MKQTRKTKHVKDAKKTTNIKIEYMCKTFQNEAKNKCKHKCKHTQTHANTCKNKVPIICSNNNLSIPSHQQSPAWHDRIGLELPIGSRQKPDNAKQAQQRNQTNAYRVTRSPSFESEILSLQRGAQQHYTTKSTDHQATSIPKPNPAYHDAIKQRLTTKVTQDTRSPSY